MTDRAKKIYDGLDEAGLRKHYSTAHDRESRDYIQKRLDALVLNEALVERGEQNLAEFFQ